MDKQNSLSDLARSFCEAGENAINRACLFTLVAGFHKNVKNVRRGPARESLDEAISFCGESEFLQAKLVSKLLKDIRTALTPKKGEDLELNGASIVLLDVVGERLSRFSEENRKKIISEYLDTGIRAKSGFFAPFHIAGIMEGHCVSDPELQKQFVEATARFFRETKELMGTKYLSLGKFNERYMKDLFAVAVFVGARNKELYKTLEETRKLGKDIGVSDIECVSQYTAGYKGGRGWPCCKGP